MHKGLVLKKQADIFTIEFESGDVQNLVARKNLKKEGVFVGDIVFVDEDNAVARIDKRKNVLIRPPVANIDKMFIVVAPLPKADLYTVDKMLIFCALNSIEPILCVNKKDLDNEFCEKIEKIYNSFVDTIVVSSFDESVLEIEKKINGICVLAGQSAVGKSSIINALKKEEVAKVDTFSKKIERGKQTTRTVQLFKFSDGYLADTAGFSKLDEGLIDLKETEIKNYFTEFLPFAEKCKYKSCTHINNKDCGVIEAVKEKKLSKERYENYVKLYSIMKNIKRY